MNKKIAKLGEKTNLTKEDVKKLTKIGISGLLALTLSVFTFGWRDSNAAEVKPVSENDTNILLPEQCKMVPEKSNCEALFTTYYFDAKINTCIQAQACAASSVFKSKEDCNWLCIDQLNDSISNGVSKYAVVSPRDFKREK